MAEVPSAGLVVSVGAVLCLAAARGMGLVVLVPPPLGVVLSIEVAPPLEVAPLLEGGWGRCGWGGSGRVGSPVVEQVAELGDGVQVLGGCVPKCATGVPKYTPNFLTILVSIIN